MVPTMTPARVSGQSARRDSLAGRVGRRLGCTAGTAEQKLYGAQRLNLQLAAMIDECGQDDTDRAALAHLVAPLLAAIHGVLQRPASATLELRAQRADLDEDLAEKAFDRCPSAATALQLVRAKDLAIILDLEARQALVTRYELPC